MLTRFLVNNNSYCMSIIYYSEIKVARDLQSFTAEYFSTSACMHACTHTHVYTITHTCTHAHIQYTYTNTYT